MLIGISAMAQKPFSIRLNEIKTDISQPGRRLFYLTYSIANESAKPIAFFLSSPDILIPQISSSSSPYVHYRLFQNGKPVDAPGLFTFGVANRFSEAEMDRKMDSVRKENRDVDMLLKKRRQNMKRSLIRLDPKQTKTFSVIMGWDLQRYQTYDEIEYYLEPNDSYTLELSVHLMKEDLSAEFKALKMEHLLNEPDLITGWFTSNRLLIDLSQ